MRSVGIPQRVLDDLEPAGDLAERVGGHLPVLGGEEARDVLAVRVQELADAEQQLGALPERPGAPGRERRLRDGHRAVDLLERSERDLAGLPAGRGVEDGAAAAGRAGDGGAADPVADLHDLARLEIARSGRRDDFGHGGSSSGYGDRRGGRFRTCCVPEAYRAG